MFEQFRFGIERFEDEMVVPSFGGHVRHVSAYDPERRAELALLDRGNTKPFRLVLLSPVGPRGDRGYIISSVDCMRKEVTFETLDPLIIRCIALDWVDKYLRR